MSSTTAREMGFDVIVSTEGVEGQTEQQCVMQLKEEAHQLRDEKKSQEGEQQEAAIEAHELNILVEALIGGRCSATFHSKLLETTSFVHFPFLMLQVSFTRAYTFICVCESVCVFIFVYACPTFCVSGLCDPDCNVRWTAVDLLGVVLKRENERANGEIGTRVLEIAVPLARLSDDGDTRAAAINVIYFAGRACRGWTAHHSATHLPDELHHHEHGNRHVSSAHFEHEDHHYLHRHTDDEDVHNIEGWTLRDVIEDRLGIYVCASAYAK